VDDFVYASFFIKDYVNLAGYNIPIEYDPSILELIEITSNGLNDNNIYNDLSPYYLNRDSFDGFDNRYLLSGASLLGIGLTGTDGFLGQVKFKVLQKQETDLTFGYGINVVKMINTTLDPNHQIMPTTYVDYQVNGDIPEEPEPECYNDEDCDDNLYCNGIETCSSGVCQSGTSIDCSSNDIEAVDGCNGFYWETRDSFTSVCNEESDSCTIGDNTITQNLDSRCGVTCELDEDCPATECDNLDGCVGNDYYDYSDVENCCVDYSCENNQCSNPTITELDSRCYTPPEENNVEIENNEYNINLGDEFTVNFYGNLNNVGAFEVMYVFDDEYLEPVSANYYLLNTGIEILYLTALGFDAISVPLNEETLYNGYGKIGAITLKAIKSGTTILRPALDSDSTENSAGVEVNLLQSHLLIGIKSQKELLNLDNINVNIQSSCIENWVCDDWSPEICDITETQTRQCIDLNECGTELNKPLTEKSCVYECIDIGNIYLYESWINITECLENNTYQQSRKVTKKNLNGCFEDIIYYEYQELSCIYETEQQEDNETENITECISNWTTETLEEYGVRTITYTDLNNCSESYSETEYYNLVFVQNKTEKIIQNDIELDIDVSGLESGTLIINKTNINPTAKTIKKSLNKFIEITTPINIVKAQLKVPYSDSELGNLNENTLRIYYYNTNTTEWESVNSWVDTTNNFVYADLTHFSLYGVFGDEKTTTRSSSSSSGGSSGGGGYYSYISQINLDNIKRQVLSVKEGSIIKVKLNGEYIEFEVDSVDYDAININGWNIEIGKEVNSKGVKFTLDRIIGKFAYLTLEKSKQKEYIEEIEEITEEQTEPETESKKEEKVIEEKDNSMFILGFLIFILGFLIFISVIFFIGAVIIIVNILNKKKENADNKKQKDTLWSIF